MKAFRTFVVGGLLTAALAASAQAETLANWTFETSVPSTAGPFAAEAGTFAGTSQASGLHASGATVYSNPVGNGSVESFSSNNWNTDDYYQFTTTTTGYQAITIAWQQTRSGTGPATFDLEWSTDGTNFSVLTNNYNIDQVTWASGSPIGGSDFGPTAGPASLDNQATIWFRMTSDSGASAAAGTNRIDNVIISGTLIPEPTTLALLAVGGLLIRRR